MTIEIKLDRRQFLASGAAVGITGALGTGSVLAAEAAKPAVRPLSGKMTYQQVRDRAREMMMPRCYVCPECNGRGPCIGQVPGFGGMGANRAFQANYDSLAAVQLNCRTVHNVKKPDMTFNFFGHKLAIPCLAAPTGGTTYNMGGRLTEAEFVTAICEGCNRAGILGAVADGIGDPIDVFEKRLQTLKAAGFKAIVGLKPRTQEEIKLRMQKAYEGGAVALTIDLDSAGRAARATPGQTVEPKTFEQLKELVKASPLPLFFKGIMTPDEAKLCVKSGAAGIVVSNHGGRVLADSCGTATVLPEIADVVNGKCMILVDGTVARGTDILKYLALGADACLAGRHFVRGAHGGLADGVAVFANRLKTELQVAMTLTGAKDLSAISEKMIRRPE